MNDEHLWMTVDDALRIIGANSTRQDIERTLIANLPSNGGPRLKEHLASVVTVMKLSDDYPDFIDKLNRVHPRFGETYALTLETGDR